MRPGMFGTRCRKEQGGTMVKDVVCDMIVDPQGLVSRLANRPTISVEPAARRRLIATRRSS